MTGGAIPLRRGLAALGAVAAPGRGGAGGRGRHPTGIDQVTHDEMAQSAPPGYTELIGRQLIASPQRKAA
jgi:hypothetical protein